MGNRLKRAAGEKTCSGFGPQPLPGKRSPITECVGLCIRWFQIVIGIRKQDCAAARLGGRFAQNGSAGHEVLNLFLFHQELAVSDRQRFPGKQPQAAIGTDQQRRCAADRLFERLVDQLGQAAADFFDPLGGEKAPSGRRPSDRKESRRLSATTASIVAASPRSIIWTFSEPAGGMIHAA